MRLYGIAIWTGGVLYILIFDLTIERGGGCVQVFSLPHSIGHNFLTPASSSPPAVQPEQSSILAGDNERAMQVPKDYQ